MHHVTVGKEQMPESCVNPNIRFATLHTDGYLWPHPSEPQATMHCPVVCTQTAVLAMEHGTVLENYHQCDPFPSTRHLSVHTPAPGRSGRWASTSPPPPNVGIVCQQRVGQWRKMHHTVTVIILAGSSLRIFRTNGRVG